MNFGICYRMFDGGESARKVVNRCDLMANVYELLAYGWKILSVERTEDLTEAEDWNAYLEKIDAEK